MSFPLLHFSNGYQPFLFLLIFFVSSFSLQLFNFLSFSTKAFCLSLTPSSLIIRNFLLLSNSLIFSNGTQKQKDLLHDFWKSLQSHPSGWSHKITGVPSIDLQAIKPTFGGCTCWIGKFFKLFLFFNFALIFYFNIFLDLNMLGFCCGMSLDENLMS